MEAMERATEPKLRAYLPVATWATIGLMVLAVLLSIGNYLYFPWHRTVEQQEAAATTELQVLLVVSRCASVGTILGVVGTVQARRRGAGVSANPVIVSVLGFLLSVLR
jgi:hypothetical protein